MIAVLWDLDGTLIDSAADIAAAMDCTLVHFGLPPLGEARVRPFIGHGAANLVARCAAAAGAPDARGMLPVFLDEYLAHPCERTRVHPAALGELLARVRSPMAVVTNKPGPLTRVILDRLGLAPRFPVVLGGEDLPDRKPHPGPVWEAMRRLAVERAVMVGDAPPDVEAARRAGIPSVGVEWGIGVPEGADRRVDDVAGLARALADFGVDL